MHGGWQGKKEYNALLKAGYGTTGWMKAAGAGAAAGASRLLPHGEVESDED